jgi:hypothetical protein
MKKQVLHQMKELETCLEQNGFTKEVHIWRNLQSDLEQERQLRLASDRYCLELETKLDWQDQHQTEENSLSPPLHLEAIRGTVSAPTKCMDDPTIHSSQVQSLQHDLSQRTEENEQLEEELFSLKMRLETVEEENTKLLSELNAFDLEFFEELEDLKFQCHQERESLAID